MPTGKETLITYLNPIIIENKKTYWGYPWDISDIVLNREGSNVLLWVSLDHDIVREDVSNTAAKKKKTPAIFFTGHSTQPNVSIGQIRNEQWVLLDRLR